MLRRKPGAIAGDDGFQPIVQLLPLFGMPGGAVSRIAGKIECRERLGGLLNYYHCKAA
jgi:hypothetical protein